jgi:hypothetical protein
MNKLFRMAYVSAVSKLFSKTGLRNLHKQARERNARTGTTGLLLHKDGRFMQMLEGPTAAVKATFGRINKDPRHHGIIVLIKETGEHRHFPGWPMAFRDLDSPEQRDVPGYSEFLITSLTGKEFASRPSQCEKLLLLFKKEHPLNWIF